VTADTQPLSVEGGQSPWSAPPVPYPAPIPDQSTAHYWEAAARGELVIKRCDNCGRAHFYPRPFCPVCWSTAVRWERASGRGTVYTFSVVRRSDLPPFRDRVPYVPAIVELAEGPRMMTAIVDVDPADVRIGMEVDVAFAPAGPDGSAAVPVFRPASAAK
jgi:uncharacterized OB-fold protein